MPDPKQDSPEGVAAATARIDALLAALPDDQRTAMGDLRAAIAAAAPDAIEAISYGAPAFRYRGRPLVSYAAAARHCSFFPMDPGVLDHYRGRLEGFDLAKGTVRFTPDRPIPPDVVAGIVRDRIATFDG